jgi:hypothetical protein
VEIGQALPFKEEFNKDKRPIKEKEGPAVVFFSVPDVPKITLKLAEAGTAKEKGSVVSDPVVSYLETLDPEERRLRIYVAHEMKPLRTIYPVINNLGKVEVITDSGSQIVLMHRGKAHELGT